MFSNDFMSQFAPGLVNSLVSAIAITLFAAFTYFLLQRKLKNDKEKHRLRSRITYISILLFGLVLIRIWIEGFSNLFTMLSLVAAGLVVTNKENIMNIGGWLIINWRGLFSEGDYIQIQNFVGYVDSIKPLHFKLYETTALGRNQATGKTIKIPNGLIITNPITIFSDSSHLVLRKISYAVTIDQKLIDIVNTARNTIASLLDEKYKDNPAFSIKVIAKKNKALANMIDMEPVVEIQPFSDKEKLITIQTSFYCYPDDARLLEQQFITSLMKSIG